MFEGNQNIAHILLRMIEQNQEVASRISEMAEIPDIKDASTQYYDERFDLIKTNFYWKLQYLASDDIGLDVLKNILKNHPNNFSELSEVLFKSVEETFAYGIEARLVQKSSPLRETGEEESSEDCETT